MNIALKKNRPPTWNEEAAERWTLATLFHPNWDRSAFKQQRRPLEMMAGGAASSPGRVMQNPGMR